MYLLAKEHFRMIACHWHEEHSGPRTSSILPIRLLAAASPRPTPEPPELLLVLPPPPLRHHVLVPPSDVRDAAALYWSAAATGEKLNSVVRYNCTTFTVSFTARIIVTRSGTFDTTPP